MKGLTHARCLQISVYFTLALKTLIDEVDTFMGVAENKIV